MKKYVFILIYILIPSFVNAHDCVLSGTTPKEIFIYNSCLSNINNPTQKNDKILSLEKKINELKDENKILKNRLGDLKRRFTNILSIIDLYIKES